MDVEQKTVIQAGMDPSQFVQAADQLASSVEDAGGRITTANAQVVQSITKVTLAQVDSGAGFQRLAAAIDPSISAMQRYEREVDALNRYLAAGRITTMNGSSAQDEYNRLLGIATDRYQAHIVALQGVGKATEGVAGSTRATTSIVREATNAYLEMSAGMSPLQIAAANFGNIEHAAEKFGGAVQVALEFLTSPTGLVLAAGAAILAIGAAAEATQSRMLELQAALRGTRDDYVSMAAEADAAARSLANSGATSLADATAAARALAAQSGFRGTQQQLQDLIQTANDLAVVMGATLPAEAAKLAAAMNDPGKMAQELADVHFKGMNSELARSIQLQADSGDKAGAYARLLDAVHTATSGAAQASKTELQKALDDLSGQFIKSGGDGKGFFETIGVGITGVAATAIEKIADVIKSLKEAYGWVMSLPGVSSSAAAVGSAVLPGGFWGGIGGGIQMMLNPAQTFGNAYNAIVGSGSSATPSYNVSSMDQITYQFTQNGLALNNAIAAAANAIRESGGNFQAVNMADAPGGSHGAFQWNGSRLAGFQAANGGLLPEQTSMAAQVAYAVQELLTSKSGTYAQMQATDDVGQKAAAFTAGFEVPADIPGQSAISAAIAKNYAGQIGVGGLTLTVSGNAAINVTPTTASPVTAMSGVTGADLSTFGPGAYSAIASIDPAQQIQDALSKATGALKTSEDLKAAIDRDTQALANLATQGITSGAEVTKLSQDLDRAQAAFDQALAPVQSLIKALGIQTDAQDRLAQAWDQGTTVAANMNLQLKAEADLRKAAGDGAAQNATAVAALTEKYREAAAAQQDAALAQASNDNQRTLDFLAAETSSLGDDAAARARNLAIIKETQDLQKNDPFASDQRKQAAIDEAAAIADATFAYQQQQQALQTLGSMTSSIFGTIADDISQAFVSGQSAAVTFGNIANAVLTQVIKNVLQLAVIAPISNGLFGTSQTTLGTILSIGSTAGAAGGSGSNGSSLLGTLSTGGSVLSGGSTLLQALGYQGLGGQINALFGGQGTSLLAGTGIGGGGTGGLFSGTGLFGSGGSLANLAATPLFGTSSAATESALAAMGGQFGPETASAYLSAGGTIAPTLGGVLGGVGGGFALGSLSGSLIQGALNKTGPAPEIGAGVGALAGAGLGTFVFPGVGTVLGGLIGGLIGGSGGGFIGPAPQSAYSGTQVGLSNGLLDVGQANQQREASSLPQTQTDVDALNAYLQANGLTITSIGNLGQIGVNGSGQVDPTKYASLGAAFPNFGFASSDTTLNKYLSGQSFPDLTTLQTAVGNYQALINTTIPALTAETKVTGSLNDALTQITATFQPAIDAANTYGVATDSLTAAQNKAIDAANAAAKAQADALGAQIAQRDATALATLGAGPAASETAALTQFDAQLQAQRDQLSTQLVGIFGDSYKTTQDFADRMAALEKTLGDERLAIVQQYTDQIAAARKAIDQTDVSLVGRAMTAQAQVSGNPVDAEAAALYNFEAGAQTQTDSLTAQFKALYGNSYSASLDYAAEMAQLETTLNAERLAIVKQYNDQITAATDAAAQAQADALAATMTSARTLADSIQAQADAAQQAMAAQNDAFFAQQQQQLAAAQAAQQQQTDQATATAAQTVASLATYVQSLQTSAASPLSPLDQYALAQRQFNAVSGAADAGDYNNVTQLQTYANTYLSASRAVNGSGAAYANDFQAVLDALDKAGTIAPDTLTASVLQTETRTQTATLVDSLTSLQNAVNAITAQLRQNNVMPARIAA